MLRAATVILTLAALLAGGDAASAASWRDAPVVPRIDGALRDHLRDELAANVAAGARADTFAKLGDSITETQAYLQAIACGEQRLGAHRGLRSTISFFHHRHFPDDETSVYCGYADSFSRASAAAMTGQRAGWATESGAAESNRCQPQESPLECEYRLIRPAFALVMFGTNDADSLSPTRYVADMRRIVAASEELEVIPILSTLPPRLDRTAANRRIGAYNAAIVRLARESRVPVINFWRALAGRRIVDGGMSEDGIHPNVYVDYECDPFCRPLDFSREALRYGYNQRNLITLETLQRLRQRLIR